MHRGMRFCSSACVKASHRRRRHADEGDEQTRPCLLGQNMHLPSLPLDGYRDQTLFHHIDLKWPGLQLVHERRYGRTRVTFQCGDPRCCQCHPEFV